MGASLGMCTVRYMMHLTSFFSLNLYHFRSLQSRVESAVSAAEKLWKEHHQSQVSRLQQQLRETTPPGPSPSTSTESAVERALQEARGKWEEEHEAKIQEALDAAKQVHIQCSLKYLA